MGKRKFNIYFALVVALIVVSLVFAFSGYDEVMFSPVLKGVEKMGELGRGVRGIVGIDEIEGDEVVGGEDEDEEEGEGVTSEEINQVKQFILSGSDPHHPDYSALYNLLEIKKGNLDTIFLICEQFDSAFLYCLKKACQQNPEFRGELSDVLVDKINERYEGMFSNAKLNSMGTGHRQDCMLGLPQFMY